jgi:hypothetical protein
MKDQHLEELEQHYNKLRKALRAAISARLDINDEYGLDVEDGDFLETLRTLLGSVVQEHEALREMLNDEANV